MSYSTHTQFDGSFAGLYPTQCVRCDAPVFVGNNNGYWGAFDTRPYAVSGPQLKGFSIDEDDSDKVYMYFGSYIRKDSPSTYGVVMKQHRCKEEPAWVVVESWHPTVEGHLMGRGTPVSGIDPDGFIAVEDDERKLHLWHIETCKFSTRVRGHSDA